MNTFDELDRLSGEAWRLMWRLLALSLEAQRRGSPDAPWLARLSYQATDRYQRRAQRVREHQE